MNQNSKPMTPSEMGKKGGTNRWVKLKKKMTPGEISEMMRDIANKKKKNDK